MGMDETSKKDPENEDYVKKVECTISATKGLKPVPGKTGPDAPDKNYVVAKNCNIGKFTNSSNEEFSTMVNQDPDSSEGPPTCEIELKNKNQNSIILLMQNICGIISGSDKYLISQLNFQDLELPDSTAA